MATDKKRLKGRLLYLFDWNAKSKKKLFSNKSESAEGSTNDGVDNLVISQYLLSELCENGDSSSFRGNGNYSSASSVIGDDVYVTKPPNVVARLMGLDSMPSTSCESSVIPSYDSQPLNTGYYHGPTTSFQHQHDIPGYGYAPNNIEGFPWNDINTKRNKIYGRPIERFQTEILPPKSAKPISITHHKLLSPIKSPGFIPTRDAAYIMEAATRIINPSPQPTNNVIRIPSLGSPSSSFRLQDLKDKMDAAQRSSNIPESSKTPKRSTSCDRSSSRSLFNNTSGLEASSSQKGKGKGKLISETTRDKTKMQRREREVYNVNKSQQQKESSQLMMKQKQPRSQKTKQIRSSDVLRQNDDKHNSASRKNKSVVNSSAPEDRRVKTSASKGKIVNKVLVNGENGSKKVVTASNGVVKRSQINGFDEKTPSLNRMKNISRNKQYRCKDNRLSDNLPNNANERSGLHNQLCQSESKIDMDVVSFTFTSPIKKSGTQTSSSNEASRSNNVSNIDTCDMSGQSHGKGSFVSPSGLNILDSGSLSLLLEQKLKELTDKVVANKSDISKKNNDTDSISCCSDSISSHDIVGNHYDDWSDKDQASTACDDDCTSSLIATSSQKWEESCGGNKRAECSVSESYMSSKTTSNVTCGDDQPSSPQSQEVTSGISSESAHRREDETDSTDVAYWELEYIRHVLHYAGLKRYGLDMDSKLIDLGIFDLLENLIITSGKNEELCSQTERKVLFDGVVEIVRSRYERVCVGSHQEWAKWEMLLKNDWLIEDIYKEILCLQSMGNLMVDEVVDRDMSTKYGRWLDFKIESLEEGMDIEEEILAMLVDELVVDLSI